MPPEANTSASRWLRQAADDLSTAERLRDLGIHYACCFFCQQSGEKALKAALLALDQIPSRTHSVAELAEALEAVSAGAAGVRNLVAVLDQYYIPTRYPDALPGGVPSTLYGKTDSARALAAAQEALAAARNTFPGSTPQK